MALVFGVAYTLGGLYAVVFTSTPEHPFSFQEWGIGFGAVATGVGMLFKLRPDDQGKPPLESK